MLVWTFRAAGSSARDPCWVSLNRRSGPPLVDRSPTGPSQPFFIETSNLPCPRHLAVAHVRTTGEHDNFRNQSGQLTGDVSASFITLDPATTDEPAIRSVAEFRSTKPRQRNRRRSAPLRPMSDRQRAHNLSPDNLDRLRRKLSDLPTVPTRRGVPDGWGGRGRRKRLAEVRAIAGEQAAQVVARLCRPAGILEGTRRTLSLTLTAWSMITLRPRLPCGLRLLSCWLWTR
jgi:hypothetical protein